MRVLLSIVFISALAFGIQSQADDKVKVREPVKLTDELSREFSATVEKMTEKAKIYNELKGRIMTIRVRLNDDHSVEKLKFNGIEIPPGGKTYDGWVKDIELVLDLYGFELSSYNVVFPDFTMAVDYGEYEW